MDGTRKAVVLNGITPAEDVRLTEVPLPAAVGRGISPPCLRASGR